MATLELARQRRRRWIKRLVLVFLFASAAGLGTVAGLLVFYADDIPDVTRIADYEPSIITRIFSSDGVVIGEFAQERRIVVAYDQIPENLRKAIIAVEDADFYTHHGINLRGIARAMIENARQGRWAQGGSSLTQQLAKLMFLTPEKSLRRKAKEAVVALHLERHFRKEEIFTMYCNKIYMGFGRYGVEAAARFLFDKHAIDLTLAEAALIAGLPQRPEGYSPHRDRQAAIDRRNHVIARMAAEHFITPEQASEAQSSDLVLAEPETQTDAVGSYFVEEVRQYLEKNYGEKTLYHDGLNVYTTLDTRLQGLAEQALREGLIQLDRRRGWRGPTLNILRDVEGSSVATWEHPTWAAGPHPLGDLAYGVVVRVDPEKVTVRIGEHSGEVTKVPAWVRRQSVGQLYQVGDVGLFRVNGLDEERSVLRLLVEQEPEVEGAVVLLDVKTGHIKAMVGGWDFRKSKFNRAVQAQRQTGSSFKPILYAAAIANGFTPADTLFDEPISIPDPWTGKVYQPKNYTNNYYGLTTLREALEKSRNPVSVQLLQRVGAHTVIEFARRLGLTSKLEPFPSLALGAFEETLLVMTSAFSAFADLGVIREPFLITRIEDRDGTILLRKNPVSRQAMPADVAYVTNYMMQGVIKSGTASAAKVLERPLSGKTGTTDDFTDAWFLGQSPSLACGVWVGFDIKRTLGKGEVGAKAALPIWMELMAGAHEGVTAEEFLKPPGVEFVTIDKATGLRATPTCGRPFAEAFLRGTAPVSTCSARDHEVRAMPYYLQKLYLSGGELPPLDSSELAPTSTSTYDE